MFAWTSVQAFFLPPGRDVISTRRLLTDIFGMLPVTENMKFLHTSSLYRKNILIFTYVDLI